MRFSTRWNYNGKIFGKLGDSNLPLGQLHALDETHRIIENTMSPEKYIYDRVRFPMIEKVVSIDEKKVCARKTLSIEHDMHLQDHCVEGKHVFAGVMHVETACEMLDLYLKENNLDDFTITDISNFNFYKFIKVFEGNPLELKLTAEIVDKSINEIKMHVTIMSDFVNKMGIPLEKNRLHSEGDVIAVRNIGNIAKNTNFVREGKEFDLEKYYNLATNAITFGKTFKCISDVKMISDTEVIGCVTIPFDGQYFAFNRNSDTCISPVTIDNIGRLMLFREFNLNGYTIVPTLINKAKQYRKMIPGEKLEVYCNFDSENGMDVIYSAYAVDRLGNVVFDIKDMQLRRINKYNGDYSLCETSREYNAAV